MGSGFISKHVVLCPSPLHRDSSALFFGNLLMFLGEIHHRHPDRLGERNLFDIEREQRLSADLDCNRDMEEVHRADHHLQRVFSPEFSSRAHRIGPVKFDMWPVADPDFLFQ